MNITATSNEHQDKLIHLPLDCLFSCLFRLTSTKTSKLCIIGPFVKGMHRWPVDSPHKGPVMWNEFPFHDVFMLVKIPNTRALLVTKNYKIFKYIFILFRWRLLRMTILVRMIDQYVRVLWRLSVTIQDCALGNHFRYQKSFVLTWTQSDTPKGVVRLAFTVCQLFFAIMALMWYLLK